jgi:3-keto-L-gulonate-6-phosphate decarboxylase
MPQRSQRHVAEIRNRIVPITGISPDTATIAAVGAIGRTVATLSVTGGTAPVIYTIANAGGLALVIVGNLLQTTADPVGTVGAKTVSILASDNAGQSKIEDITVTVT